MHNPLGEFLKPDTQARISESLANRYLKLGSIFFWPERNHRFMFLGPVLSNPETCYFVFSTSDPKSKVVDNFTIYPEDFKNCRTGLKGAAFTRPTHFLFRNYYNFIVKKELLVKLFVNKGMDYLFNLKKDMPDTYKRLQGFLEENLPPNYFKYFTLPDNICS